MDEGTALLHVGGLSRGALLAKLQRSGVKLNDLAITLLNDPIFESDAVESIRIVYRAVDDLGLHDGGSLSQILAVAEQRGLRLCHPTTGPYLRLLMMEQESAPDSIMSNGRAPSGSITVASAPLRDDDEYPKGFYLRVVGGVWWLRGYVCDDSHVWSPGDRFAFGCRQ